MDSGDIERLNANLALSEGMMLKPYDDATGKQLKPGDVLIGNISIGIGHNLSQDGITNPQMFCLRDDDVNRHKADVEKNILNFDMFTGPRQASLIEMCFCMGIVRMLGFKRMIAELRMLSPNWNKVADEALDSEWARNPKWAARAQRIAGVLRCGYWPHENS